MIESQKFKINCYDIKWDNTLVFKIFKSVSKSNSESPKIIIDIPIKYKNLSHNLIKNIKNFGYNINFIKTEDNYLIINILNYEKK